MKTIRIILWLTVAVAGLILIIAAARHKSIDTDQPPKLLSSGSIMPGGFSLTAHTGESVSAADFKGHYQLIYFGYSFCPDVCPIELQKMSAAMTILEEKNIPIDAIQPIFISVDPARDTPQELTQFLTGFHPSFIALTGTEQQIKQAAKNHKIQYQMLDAADDGFYLVNHSNVILLMDQQGRYLKLFSSMDTPDDIAATFELLLSGD